MKKETKDIIVKGIIGVAIAIALTLIYLYRTNIYYFFLRLAVPKTSNKENDIIIEGLHPVFALSVAKLVNELEAKGETVRLNSGYRSPEKQQQLLDAGQTSTKPNNSYHNYGLAVDMNVSGLRKSSSRSSWLNVLNGTSFDNMRWGGYFNDHDPIHFDYGNEKTISELKNLLPNGLVSNKFVKF